MANKFVCVVDKKLYDPQKTRAEYKGLCSMRCQHQLARECGFRPKHSKFAEWTFITKELRRRRAMIEGAEPFDELENRLGLGR